MNVAARKGGISFIDAADAHLKMIPRKGIPIITRERGGIMKVSEIKYERLTIEAYAKAAQRIISTVKGAKSTDEALKAREEYVALSREFLTAATVAEMRYTLNTVDSFYLAEKDYYDEITPKVRSFQLEYAAAMLESPLRKELEKALSPLLFTFYEVQVKSMSPLIVDDMIEENRLVTEYSQLMAGMTFDFAGKSMPLSMLRRYMEDEDRSTRRAAYETLGLTLEKHSEQLDTIFDKLVKVRDRMAKKMGYQNFVPLGYYRLNRLSYDETMVKDFRESVRRYAVPAVARLRTENAQRLGIDRFMLYDNDVNMPGGDPKPILDKEGIFRAAQEMYHDMGEETGRFIDVMMDAGAFDVESRKNKWGGAYCTMLPKYKQPFILANFNGTAGDIETITHEAGHAFADYMTADNRFAIDMTSGRAPEGYGMETGEVHSMSMEFFAWKYNDRFFGDKAPQHEFCHVMDALTFIPYGTIVDYFQHIVYENPDMTPAERNAAWNRLEAQFRPYLSTEGIPYLSKGTRWQYQMHIYESPFYYIDYCLAQSVALEFLFASQQDYDSAFKRYVRFVSHGGDMKFADLVLEAGLLPPFEQEAVRGIVEEAEVLIRSLWK